MVRFYIRNHVKFACDKPWMHGHYGIDHGSCTYHWDRHGHALCEWVSVNIYSRSIRGKSCPRRITQFNPHLFNGSLRWGQNKIYSFGLQNKQIPEMTQWTAIQLYHYLIIKSTNSSGLKCEIFMLIWDYFSELSKVIRSYEYIYFFAFRCSIDCWEEIPRV